MNRDSIDFAGFADQSADAAQDDLYSIEELIKDEEENSSRDATVTQSRAVNTTTDAELYVQANDLFLTDTLESGQQSSSAFNISGLSSQETVENHSADTVEHTNESFHDHNHGGVSVIDTDTTIVYSGGGGVNSGKPTATVAQFTDYMVNGFWQDFGGSARSWSQNNVTFSISNSYSAAQKDGFRMAFQQWQDVADITFSEVGSGGMIDIRLGNDGSAYSSSGTSGGNILSNFISIDISVGGWTNFNDIGDYAMLTAIHEIGHSLGLGHTGNYNGSANYANDAVWANDTRQYSVMSYFDANNSGSDHSDVNGWQYGSTPALFDIYAIQQIYGANMSARTGNTTYGFNSNAGRSQFDFTQNNGDPVVSIWDASGTDTLDLSGYSMAQTIRLGAGEFSDIGGMTGNVSIAYNTVIENATGGSGADSIYGNSSNNMLLGGGGNDVLFASTGSDILNGQAGTDTANYANYTTNAFSYNFIDSVTVTLTHLVQSWQHTLSNIENFIFNGGSYTFATLQSTFGIPNLFAPTVAANALSLSVDQVVLASSTITANDADGNVLSYEVWDSTAANNSGYFELAGNRLSAGGGHVLTQTQFNTLNIVGGDVAGTDQFWVRVSDGINTTAWKTFNLTTTAGGGGGVNLAAPTVNANALSLNVDQVALASSTITANDADGNALSYEVWDSTAVNNSGYFELAGNRLSAGGGHVLTQAQFSTLNIVGGDVAGTDQFWVRVSDGAHTTAWKSFNLTTTAGGGGGGVNLAAPTVNANALSLNVDQVALASSTITANDADGNALSYEVWDSTAANNSGYFELAGNRLSSGGGHVLTQAQFSTLNIVGGDVAGTDQFWVRVSDGAHTTAWKSFNLTTTSSAGANNFAPTVNANGLTLDFTMNTLASNVITANDADGNTLTYEVWDSTAAGNSGYFDLGGTRLNAGVGHTLTQAQFSTLRIYSGTVEASDQLWARVSDGKFTTAWKQFTLTTNDPNNMIAAHNVLDMGHDDDVVVQSSQSSGANDSGQTVAGQVFSGVSGFQEDNTSYI